jgi:hypothetical protein
VRYCFAGAHNTCEMYKFSERTRSLFFCSLGKILHEWRAGKEGTSVRVCLLCASARLFIAPVVRSERNSAAHRNTEITKFHPCTAHFLCMRNAHRVIKYCFVSSAATVAAAAACRKISENTAKPTFEFGNNI